MSLFGDPDGVPCCCLAGCCPGYVLPDCLTMELSSSCCTGDTASIVLTAEQASTCDGGESRPFTAAEAFCGGTPDIIYTGALPSAWCPEAELSNGTVLVFCCVNPSTGESEWWMYIADGDLSHTWYPASTAQYYRLDLISCDPLLLMFGTTPECPSSCVWTWQAACFVSGTLVRTPAGEVPIESLKVGDDVIDIHGDTVQVVRLYTDEVGALVQLTDEQGTQTGVTPEHPFFALDMVSTIEAGQLVKGQRLPLNKTLTSVKAFKGRFTVHNLEVSGSNSFQADGYAVHNKGQS